MTEPRMKAPKFDPTAAPSGESVMSEFATVLIEKTVLIENRSE